MSRLPLLTPQTAAGAARDMLGDLDARHGQVGEMVRTMANSPALLGGYLQLSRSMKRAKLDRRISERISIAAQVRQGCELRRFRAVSIIPTDDRRRHRGPHHHKKPGRQGGRLITGH